jgi:uncharacterized protein
MHGYLAGHGYACIRLDIRGTGDSEGHPARRIFGAGTAGRLRCDRLAGRAGLVRRAGRDDRHQLGRVQRPADRRPPAARAEDHHHRGSTDDRYATDIHWVGGCLSKDNFDWSSPCSPTRTCRPIPPSWARPGAQMWQARMQANTPWILTWLRHQRAMPTGSRGRSARISRDHDPGLCRVGLGRQLFSESVPRLLAGLSGPRRGLIGPGRIPSRMTCRAARDRLAARGAALVRPLDEGRDTGIMDEPLTAPGCRKACRPHLLYRPPRPLGGRGRLALAPDRLAAAGTSPPAVRFRAVRRDGRGVSICSPLWVGLRRARSGATATMRNGRYRPARG